MAVKLSQIVAAGAAPATTDQIVGVTAGVTDNLFSLSQIATTVLVTVGLTVGTATVKSGVSGNFLYNNAGILGERTPTQATAALNLFTSGLQGLVPASGGGTTNFLRADGTWTAAAGAPGGSSGQIQYDNAGAFGGAGLWRNSANLITQSNGVNAQNLYIYNTTDTDGGTPTNFERGDFGWVSNVLTIGIDNGGTGSANRLLRIAGGSFANGLVFAVGSISGGSDIMGINFNGTTTSVQVASQSQYAWVSGANPLAGPIAGIGLTAAKVMCFSDGQSNSGTNNGWLQWAGEARLDADFSATSNTTLANVTGSTNNLSVTLIAGRKYIFDICLLMVTGASLGGIKIGLAGTATVTNLIADGWCLDGTTNVAVTRVSASPGTLVANTNAGTAPVARFMGTFECNAAGTFTVQFAQNVSNATASTVKRGSYMKVHDAP